MSSSPPFPDAISSRELVFAANAARDLASCQRGLANGVRDFGDIDVPARIQRDAVGSDEVAQSLADRLSAEMGQHFPFR